ncbi:MAG: HD domain-containing protein [Deltaproteobacteria bacterium]|nr:HD domain-containing protein [Deltaproteobacteria bacterium]
MPAHTDSPRLGDRFVAALAHAFELHQHQVRKGNDIPYMSHLLAVAALVIEHGGDEEEAIAALLHDAVEDQGGLPTLEAIRGRFGERVADIVLGCSDAFGDAHTVKPPWRERKVKYLDHFREASASVRLVSMADKLHNCRSTVADLHATGAATWSRFNASREDQLWFYRTFSDLARALAPSRLADELHRAVLELEALA